MSNPILMEHQRKRVELSQRVARRAARLWRSIQAANIDAGWDVIAPELERIVASAQLSAASMAPRYVSAALRDQDAPSAGAKLEPRAFSGVTLEGRQIAPELYSAATTTKTLIGRGVGVGAAFTAGTALMSIMAATMVRDAGNMADKVVGVGHKTVQYARVLSPGACSRCAILAGVGHFTKHFERHPECKCTTVPIYDGANVPEGLMVSPEEYFDSLSKAEQDRIFTKAGAEAIRMGASPISVVNARRGMYSVRQPGSLVARAHPQTIIGPDGKPFLAYTTVEGTTIRGWYGGGYGGSQPGRYVKSVNDRYRRTTSVRLMPETIMSLAGGDPDKAIALLRQYGYFS